MSENSSVGNAGQSKTKTFMRTSCMEVMGPIWELWGLSRTPLQLQVLTLLSASFLSRKRAGCVLGLGRRSSGDRERCHCQGPLLILSTWVMVNYIIDGLGDISGIKNFPSSAISKRKFPQGNEPDISRLKEFFRQVEAEVVTW